MLLICVTGDIIYGINKLGRRRKSSTPESQQSRASYGSVSQPSYHSSDYTGYYDQVESERVRALRIAFWFLAMSQILLLISLCLRINENAESLSKLVAEREEIEKETMHLEDERQTLERERLFLKEERKRWERAREGLRVPHGAFWEVVWPKWECLSYGRREYWGILGNIPEDRTDIDACMNMPVEIKGVTIKRPSRCQFLGDSPHVHGFWMVDWDQPDCKPWHEDFIDRGCTNPGSGARRIEASVVGINSKGQQDWRVLCESTPMTWDHITYGTPTHCTERDNAEKVAMWDIPDDSC